jgi:REP element-mobilizing transposase RayT
MKKPLFTPSAYFHIYNHANGKDNLFVERINYFYFLDRWRYYTKDLFDVLAFCLMPNHFHMLVKVKEKIELKNDRIVLEDPLEISGYISQQLSNHFNSYTKSINKRYKRMGSLFNQNFKRKLVENDSYLKILLCYIHLNPVNHGFANQISAWEFSSIHDYLTNRNSWIKKEMVQEMFNSSDDFIDLHDIVLQAERIKDFYF